jgi:hypothetical protein
VAIRLPPFYAEEPGVWFVSAEAQFTLAGITKERTKFYHVKVTNLWGLLVVSSPTFINQQPPTNETIVIHKYLIKQSYNK